MVSNPKVLQGHPSSISLCSRQTTRPIDHWYQGQARWKIGEISLHLHPLPTSSCHKLCSEEGIRTEKFSRAVTDWWVLVCIHETTELDQTLALELAKSGLRASHGGAPSIGRKNMVALVKIGVTVRYVQNSSSDGVGWNFSILSM